MKSAGTFEAKTHLTRLLEHVAKGERIVIINRGRPAAIPVPPELAEQPDSAAVGRAMLAYGDEVKRRLGGSFRDLAHDAHRY